MREKRGVYQGRCCANLGEVEQLSEGRVLEVDSLPSVALVEEALDGFPSRDDADDGGGIHGGEAATAVLTDRPMPSPLLLFSSSAPLLFSSSPLPPLVPSQSYFIQS